MRFSIPYMRKHTQKKIKRFVDGSISVFLVIVLVPIVTTAALFVEASRYQLAQGQLAAAADLTLNSALANYDTVLKDVYGIFAVSQTDEEKLEEELKGYFVEMVDGMALGSEASGEVERAVEGIFSGDTTEVTNLLGMKVDAKEQDGSGTPSESDIADPTSAVIGGAAGGLATSNDAFSLGHVDESDLARSDILKNGIVEYCKYRTPVDTGLKLLENLKALKNVSKQTDVLKSDAEVAEKTQDVNDKGAKLYLKLKEYLDYLSEHPYSHGALRAYLMGGSFQQQWRNTVVVPFINAYSCAKLPGWTIESDGGKKTGYRVKAHGEEYKTVSEDQSARDYELGKAWAPWGGVKQEDGSWKPSHEHSFEKGHSTTEIDIAGMPLLERDKYLADYSSYMQDVHYLAAVVEKFGYEPEGDEEDGRDDASAAKSVIETYALSYQALVGSFAAYVEEQKQSASTGISAAVSDVQGFIGRIQHMRQLIGEGGIFDKGALRLCDELKESVTAVTTANSNFQEAITNYEGRKNDNADTFSSEMQAEHDSYEASISTEKLEGLKNRLKEIDAYLNEAETFLGTVRFATLSIKEYTQTYDFLQGKLSSTDSAAIEGVSACDYIISHKYMGVDDLANKVSGALYRAAGEASLPPSSSDGEECVRFDGDPFWVYLCQAYSGLESEKSTDDAKKAGQKRDEASTKDVIVEKAKDLSSNKDAPSDTE